VSTAELDTIAERFIREHGGVPTFLGYRGFPASICTSPNDMVVHGIPDEHRMAEGDIMSIDVGVTLDGYVADSALTLPMGAVDDEAARLMEVTRASLEAGLGECREGRRLGDISHAVQEVVEAAGFSVVRSLVGHGVGREMHEDPQIPNYGPPHRGPAAWRRAWSSPSSRWSTWATTMCSWPTTAGPSTRPTARARRTSSTPWPWARNGPQVLTRPPLGSGRAAGSLTM